MKPTISIIIPVYNVSKFLEECVNSILAQSYEDFEVLLIDDGSTDGCGDICDNYALVDSRIKVIHKTNGGVSSARNVGINHAHGEWITFIDADDIVYKDLLRDYISSLETAADLYIQGFEDSDGNKVHVDYKEWVGDDILIKLEDIRGTQLENFVWNKLYRTSIIRDYNIRFNEKIEMVEDGLFNYLFIIKSRYVVNLPVINYYYRRHGASACFKKHSFESWDNLIISFNYFFDTLPPAYEKFIEKGKNTFYNLSLDIVRSLYIDRESMYRRRDFIKRIREKFKNVKAIKWTTRKGLNNKILTILIMKFPIAVCDFIIYCATPLYKR